MDVVDHHSHQRIFKIRAIVTFLACVLLFLILLLRLAFLQLEGHEHFQALSKNNRVKLLAIPPPRGWIFDRNGEVLAQNIPSFRLEIVKGKVDDIDETLAGLSEIFTFTESELQRFKRSSRRGGHFKSVPIKFNLNEHDVATFAVQKHRFPGVEIVGYLLRDYPHKSLGAHAIGYVGRINQKDQKRIDEDPDLKANYSASTHIGKTGIEQFYEEALHGKAGHQTVEVNVQGRVIRVLDRVEAVSGQNLFLTIDKDLQIAAEKALGGETGVALMMDVKSGEILAFASMPTFDLMSFVNGIGFEDYAKLRDDTELPLFNRVTRGRYPPGSILKPFIGLGALERRRPFASEGLYCKGYYQIGNDTSKHKYRDWKKSGHGFVDLHDSIVESCDVYFYELSLHLGINTIHDILTGFGYGEKTGIDLRGEKAGLIPNREWKKRTYKKSWYKGETLISSIGQGFMLATPLQMLSSTATLASSGERVKPHLLLRAENNQGDLLSEFDPRVENRPVVNERAWNEIRHAMKGVIHGYKGTAKKIADRRYTIAGKTGTAQVKSIAQDATYDAEKLLKKQRDHALFAGYAPAENPEVAVMVLVENGGSGGAVAAPMAKKLFDAYMLDKKRAP